MRRRQRSPLESKSSGCRRFRHPRRIVPGVTFTRVSLPLDLHCKHGHGERERERQPVKTGLLKNALSALNKSSSATGIVASYSALFHPVPLLALPSHLNEDKCSRRATALSTKMSTTKVTTAHRSEPSRRQRWHLSGKYSSQILRPAGLTAAYFFLLALGIGMLCASVVAECPADD